MACAQFILASGSSRRRELLEQMGLRYMVVTADISENPQAGEAPANYVNRMACEKARRVAATVHCGLPVLAADTAVVLEGAILGKPASTAHAREMLSRLSGRTHEVSTAVVLITNEGAENRSLSVSRVTFARLETDWITAYCNTSEPLDKAGGYAIQGFAAQWISHLEGSYSGVMGLPLYETMELLRWAGICTSPPINVN